MRKNMIGANFMKKYERKIEIRRNMKEYERNIEI